VVENFSLETLLGEGKFKIEDKKTSAEERYADKNLRITDKGTKNIKSH